MPYGIYDLAANSGWVRVGFDHDTAAFAVNNIRQWWLTVERLRYREATRLLITAKPPRRRPAAAATARGCGCGNANCRSWPTNSSSTRGPATCRPEPASGTKSSTASSSPSSVRTGARQATRQLSRDHRAVSATTSKTGLTVRCVQIPTEGGRLFRFQSGHCSDLKSAPSPHGEGGCSF